MAWILIFVIPLLVLYAFGGWLALAIALAFFLWILAFALAWFSILAHDLWVFDFFVIPLAIAATGNMLGMIKAAYKRNMGF